MLFVILFMTRCTHSGYSSFLRLLLELAGEKNFVIVKGEALDEKIEGEALGDDGATSLLAGGVPLSRKSTAASSLPSQRFSAS